MTDERLCRLILDDTLTLTGDNTSDDGIEFTLQAFAEEATPGNPVPVDESVERWLIDGAAIATQSVGDREPYFKIQITAATTAGLVAGEAALTRIGERLRGANVRTTLEWVPPEGSEWAASSIFVVKKLHLETIFDDWNEVRLERWFGVRMVADPWVRSKELTYATTVLTADSPTVTVVDACTSLAAWDGDPGAPTLGTGTVDLSLDVTSGSSQGTRTPSELMLRRSGTTATGGLPYVRIVASVRGAGTKGTPILAGMDGSLMGLVAAHGDTRWYEIPEDVTSFDQIEVATSVVPTRAGTVVLSVDEVALTDSVSTLGTGAQTFRSIEVGGSVRTHGSLHISHLTDGLGEVLVHTIGDCGNGYVPAMRTWRSSGPAPVTDGTAVSGQRDQIVPVPTPEVSFTVPGSSITPGDYVIVARLKSTTTDPMPLAVFATVAGVPAAATALVDFPVANQWQWAILGVWTLPPHPIPAESEVPVVFEISPDLSSPDIPSVIPTVDLDDLYCLNITDDPTGGAVTIVDVDTATNLWIDAPTETDPYPRIYVGNDPDRTDAVGVDLAKVTSLMGHLFTPGITSVFIVTPDASNADVELTHFHRWHSNAGD